MQIVLPRHQKRNPNRFLATLDLFPLENTEQTLALPLSPDSRERRGRGEPARGRERSGGNPASGRGRRGRPRLLDGADKVLDVDLGEGVVEDLLDEGGDALRDLRLDLVDDEVGALAEHVVDLAGEGLVVAAEEVLQLHVHRGDVEVEEGVRDGEALVADGTDGEDLCLAAAADAAEDGGEGPRADEGKEEHLAVDLVLAGHVEGGDEEVEGEDAVDDVGVDALRAEVAEPVHFDLEMETKLHRGCTTIRLELAMVMVDAQCVQNRSIRNSSKIMHRCKSCLQFSFLLKSTHHHAKNTIIGRRQLLLQCHFKLNFLEMY